MRGCNWPILEFICGIRKINRIGGWRAATAPPLLPRPVKIGDAICDSRADIRRELSVDGRTGAAIGACGGILNLLCGWCASAAPS